MTKTIITLPENVKKAIDILYAGGFSAYAVGGCVRDSIMGRVPNDWDITTSAKPDDMLELFGDYKVILTGIKHGTVTVLMDGDLLEITSYRQESGYSDHRHPDSVEFTSDITEDLKRRDFTINAMAYNHIEGFIDLFGGMDDIRNRIIRCVGDPERRFREDALRILRGVRFASVLGFDIESSTSDAMLKLRSDLKYVADERITEEFKKLICGKNALKIIKSYQEVIFEFIPELAPMVGCGQISRYHIYDVWNHTMAAFEHCVALTGDLETRLAVLFHDIGKPEAKIFDEVKQVNHFYGHAPISAQMTDVIMQRLKFDNKTRDNVVWLVDRHSEHVPLKEIRVKRLIASAGEKQFIRLLHLMECDNSAKAPHVVQERHGYTELTLGILRKLKEEEACLSLKSLLINGRDLIDLGYKPGKEMGAVLQRLLDEVIEGRLKNDPDTLRNRAKKMLAMYSEE